MNHFCSRELSRVLGKWHQVCISGTHSHWELSWREEWRQTEEGSGPVLCNWLLASSPSEQRSLVTRPRPQHGGPCVPASLVPCSRTDWCSHNSARPGSLMSHLSQSSLIPVTTGGQRPAPVHSPLLLAADLTKLVSTSTSIQQKSLLLCCLLLLLRQECLKCCCLFDLCCSESGI